MNRSEPTDFDRLSRRWNKRYREGRSEAVLRESIADVADHRDCSQGAIRRMTFAEFNAVLDEVTSKPRYGPDANKPVLWWEEEAFGLTRKNWQFLSVVWCRYGVSFAEIGERIWENEAVDSNRVRQRMSRGNEQLKKLGIDIVLSSNDGSVSPIDNWPN